jgi:hypothetical protein
VSNNNVKQGVNKNNMTNKQQQCKAKNNQEQSQGKHQVAVT